MDKIYNYEKFAREGKNINQFLKLYLASDRKERNTDFSLNDIHFDDEDLFVNFILDDFYNNKIKVAVIGDYDVDGIMSTAIVGKTLDYVGVKNDLILPNRFKNGYGLSVALVDEAIKRGCKAIITVDNGIVAFDAIEYARKNDVKIIITDHHLPSDKLPNANLIICPTLKKDNIKTSNICGAFTAFVLCKRVLNRLKCNAKFIESLAELAGIATLADQMDMTYENLKLTKWLLYRMHTYRFRNLGLKLLAQDMFLNFTECSEEDILFSIVPALNATGRMEDASIGLSLVMETDPKKMISIIAKIVTLNNYRKSYSRKYAKVLVNRINDKDINCNVCILDKTKYDKDIDIDLSGIVGIIASNIVESTNKPSFVFYKTDNGTYHGSGRTLEGFNLFEFVSSKKEQFTCNKMGGHAGAMGMTFENETDLENFRKALNSEQITLPESSKSYIRLTTDMDLNEISKAVDSFGPYGPTYSKPSFMIEAIPEKAIIFAKEHIQFTVTSFANMHTCTYFFNKEIDKLKTGEKVRIFFTFAKNNGKVQLNVEKILEITKRG